VKFGPSTQEIERMFGDQEIFDTTILPDITFVLNYDIIVSSSDENSDCDLFTPEGQPSIWLHSINNERETITIVGNQMESKGTADEIAKKHKVIFCVNP
jgi:hypothetical protein